MADPESYREQRRRALAEWLEAHGVDPGDVPEYANFDFFTSGEHIKVRIPVYKRNADGQRYCEGGDEYGPGPIAMDTVTVVQHRDFPTFPGRPEVGGAVHVRLGDLLEQVDAWAAERDMNRAMAIRALISKALSS